MIPVIGRQYVYLFFTTEYTDRTTLASAPPALVCCRHSYCLDTVVAHRPCCGFLDHEESCEPLPFLAARTACLPMAPIVWIPLSTSTVG